jgi:hypothetical protein
LLISANWANPLKNNKENKEEELKNEEDITKGEDGASDSTDEQLETKPPKQTTTTTAKPPFWHLTIPVIQYTCLVNKHFLILIITISIFNKNYFKKFN